MLKDLDVNMVLIGHSEVRSHLHETDTIINKKNQVLLEQNMTPILCIGETLNEFESGQTINVLQKQLELALQNINPSKITQLIIAYEPVWAIGTGKTATAELIQKTFHEIKKILQNLVKENVDKIPLLYGGSVNEKNAAEILRIQHVNGVLVGGASLDPQKFYDIIRSSPNYQKFTQGQ
jgi:triosephosphate isomerase